MRILRVHLFLLILIILGAFISDTDDHLSSQDRSFPTTDLQTEVVKLSELFSDLSKYDEKTVTITGKVVKVNNNILNRNWIHIQDGSGENLDLTVTTEEELKIDSEVTITGTISLNVDFGAGYVYKVIMQKAITK